MEVEDVCGYGGCEPMLRWSLLLHHHLRFEVGAGVGLEAWKWVCLPSRLRQRLISPTPVPSRFRLCPSSHCPVLFGPCLLLHFRSQSKPIDSHSHAPRLSRVLRLPLPVAVPQEHPALYLPCCYAQGDKAKQHARVVDEMTTRELALQVPSAWF